MSIHPLAAVAPSAEIGSDVHIGPFCVVEADVMIGSGCVLHNHVIVKCGTSMGADNRVCEGAVLGGLPQHVHAPQQRGRVLIGSGNTIRENVTIHGSLDADQSTVVGNDNLLMVAAHIAHDCHIGNRVIVTNNVLLAGHVRVDDRAYLSGAVAVHQYCRIGRLAMVGGQGHITRDVPPFVTVDGLSSLVVGLNQVGLRRAGFDQQTIRRLKEAYRALYRSGLPWSETLERLKLEFPDVPAAEFYAFCSTTQRGVIPERRLPPGATLKLRPGTESEPAPRAKAG